MNEASVNSPIYSKVQHDNNHATKTFMLVCDEGWRLSIVCTGMYEYVADWLINIIQGTPYPQPAHKGIELTRGSKGERP